MTSQILNWLQQVRKQLPFTPGRVLEVGSLDLNGSPRMMFKDAAEYIGIDMTPGAGVDIPMFAHEMLPKFGEASFDTILCCEMLEHDINFPRTLWQIGQMLKPGGILIITSPTFGFPLHRYPYDYWRFGEDAFRQVFFKDYELLNLEFLDDDFAPKLTIAGIGRKP